MNQISHVTTNRTRRRKNSGRRISIRGIARRWGNRYTMRRGDWVEVRSHISVNENTCEHH